MPRFLSSPFACALLLFASLPIAHGQEEFAKAIKNTTFHRHDGNRFRKAKLEKTPKYFFLYYAASW